MATLRDLVLRVPQSLLDKMTAAEIVAHCVWEMTFYGFTQEKIAAFVSHRQLAKTFGVA